MARHGRSFIEARAKVDREHEHQPAEAVKLVKDLKRAKFDESVEIHVRTGLNVRHADEQLRGTIALPNGLGKSVTVAVFAKGDKAREAEEAGADVVGAEDLAERIEGGFTEFDVAIATPDLMPVVGRLGRILGPQGRGGIQGGQDRVPHRSHRDRPPDDRQDVVRRARAAGELRRGHRRARAGQAVGGQGALHPLDHHGLDHGPGREGRPEPHP
jgi:hypothetical protein